MVLLLIGFACLLCCKEMFLSDLQSAVENSGESGEITTTHLLLGIWSEKESAGHKILSALGFTDEKAEELGKSVSDTC